MWHKWGHQDRCKITRNGKTEPNLASIVDQFGVESQPEKGAKLKVTTRDAWVARSVARLTLDFSSSHDPRVEVSSPVMGFVLNVEPAQASLPLYLCPSSSLVLSLSTIKF